MSDGDVIEDPEGYTPKQGGLVQSIQEALAEIRLERLNEKIPRLTSSKIGAELCHTIEKQSVH